MTQDNKRTFKTEIDGETLEIAVVRPSAAVSNAAHMHYQREWSSALKRGCLLQKKLEDYLQEQGLWNEDKQKNYEKLIAKIRKGEEALVAGQIKLSEGYDIAVKEMRTARVQLQILLSERNILEQNSAEGVAEQQRFNFLVSKCVLNNATGKPIFADVEDYINKSDQSWAFQAAAVFSQLNNGLDSDFLASLPENKFLKTWGFVDEYYRLVDKEGNLVDEYGKLVNELGQWVNEDGELVDENGKAIDDEGNLRADEDAVFYDDEGNPVLPPQQKKKEDKKVSDEVQSSESEVKKVVKPNTLPDDKLDEEAEVSELQKA